MKAVVIWRYGSAEVLQYEEVAQPQIKPNQLLVRVHASSVNPIDWKTRQGMLSLLTGNNFPLILGFDVAGEVVAVGSQVTRFQMGDAVYGGTSFPGGAYGEFAAVPENLIAPKPTNLTYEEAATLPLAALTALQALRDQGNIKSGQSVLINGASGGVGMFAVQIAKTLGTEVTGVCSTRNLEFVKSLGADRVIDYTQKDFTEEGRQYDIIFDAVGKRSLSNCKRVLTPNGIYISTLPTPEVLIQSVLTAFLPGQKAKFVIERPNTEDLVYLKELIEAGKLRTVIDRSFPLAEIGLAHSYSESERTVGKIAIVVLQD
ncbi:NAD(P)-dependent alcohol dehydrogenase [Nodularia sp. UHCC 0506]|uniref:NAD(P)-dependent alcohol dehydrogenase n=1 Tax=Nodularia sp. UHCC 0506 TaxID=3110243 RepID=UPI002B20A3E2|nr:NAD(P)-dependent alcohol dehydrogenase [Nodularia sp. UHCC 0506]MEA5514187.1 NAD(P)-dependent alcohol dehydrogenase [Nodularia sp. UHCC 0506]